MYHAPRRRVPAATGPPAVTVLSVNDDSSCLLVGSENGLRLFLLKDGTLVKTGFLGHSVSAGAILGQTSLVAFTSAGAPGASPRRVVLGNISAGEIIKGLPSAPTSVLSIHLSATRVVAVMKEVVHVYDLHTLRMVRAIGTPPNPSGVAALAVAGDAGPCLALPSRPDAGFIAVHALEETQGALAEFPAHRHSLAALAWWRGGDLIASASRQGTIIRVHTAAGTPVCAVRRGSLGASVYGLSFCVEQENGAQDHTLLCASTSHGTVHVFRVPTRAGTARSADWGAHGKDASGAASGTGVDVSALLPRSASKGQAEERPEEGWAADASPRDRAHGTGGGEDAEMPSHPDSVRQSVSSSGERVQEAPRGGEVERDGGGCDGEKGAVTALGQGSDELEGLSGTSDSGSDEAYELDFETYSEPEDGDGDVGAKEAGGARWGSGSESGLLLDIFGGDAEGAGGEARGKASGGASASGSEEGAAVGGDSSDEGIVVDLFEEGCGAGEGCGVGGDGDGGDGVARDGHGDGGEHDAMPAFDDSAGDEPRSGVSDAEAAGGEPGSAGVGQAAEGPDGSRGSWSWWGLPALDLGSGMERVRGAVKHAKRAVKGAKRAAQTWASLATKEVTGAAEAWLSAAAGQPRPAWAPSEQGAQRDTPARAFVRVAPPGPAGPTICCLSTVEASRVAAPRCEGGGASFDAKNTRMEPQGHVEGPSVDSLMAAFSGSVLMGGQDKDSNAPGQEGTSHTGVGNSMRGADARAGGEGTSATATGDMSAGAGSKTMQAGASDPVPAPAREYLLSVATAAGQLVQYRLFHRGAGRGAGLVVCNQVSLLGPR